MQFYENLSINYSFCSEFQWVRPPQKRYMIQEQQSHKKKNGPARDGQKNRKGRLENHFLKEHVPDERIPYSCALCKFRCHDAQTPQKHLTAYARHV